jgi:hypothetical protein
MFRLIERCVIYRVFKKELYKFKEHINLFSGRGLKLTTHLHTYSAQVKNGGAILPFPHMSSWLISYLRN